jgi:hypothetical protein
MFVILAKWESGAVGVMSVHPTKDDAEQWKLRYELAEQASDIVIESVEFVIEPAPFLA